MDPLSVMVGTLATVTTMAVMYLYLFRVVLPRAIAQGMSQAGDLIEKATNRAQDMVRKERERTLREVRNLAADVLIASDERLRRLEGIVAKLPFSTGRKGGGGILGGLSKSLGVDLGDLAAEAIPAFLNSQPPGGSVASPSASPTPPPPGGHPPRVSL